MVGGDEFGGAVAEGGVESGRLCWLLDPTVSNCVARDSVESMSMQRRLRRTLSWRILNSEFVGLMSLVDAGRRGEDGGIAW